MTSLSYSAIIKDNIELVISAGAVIGRIVGIVMEACHWTRWWEGCRLDWCTRCLGVQGLEKLSCTCPQLLPVKGEGEAVCMLTVVSGLQISPVTRIVEEMEDIKLLVEDSITFPMMSLVANNAVQAALANPTGCKVGDLLQLE